MSNQN